MLKKIITYSIAALLVLFAGTIILSPEYRSDAKIIWYSFVGDKVSRMEAQVDQGTLALARYDQAYNSAYNKLTALMGSQTDALVCARRARETAEAQRKEGREDLALRSEEQAVFFESKHETVKNSIEKRKTKLEELKKIRERAYQDVRFARQRIAMMQTMRDSLDDAGMQEVLDKAEQNVANLQSNCNRLNAEIDVLMMMD
ncbi:MAG: hypothetical protein IJ498_09510 [Akkermansia sp.]|nr:hypothetical protein [Akkermansia sp.]